MSDKPKQDPETLHWLVRPKTIKLMWIVGLLSLALLTAASLTVHPHATFGIEATPAFYSWYGFITCVAMVLFAKFVLGKLLSRKDTYYDE
ncbi:MAG TPA: hypothetical protein VIN57_02810 [Magnetovibrio sp.]